ncbi:MAG: hypothetical protein ACREN7_08180 [Candidatus Dormibacteria bacterium]
MRPAEEEGRRALLSTLSWHRVDTETAEETSALARPWRPTHHAVHGADLAINATTVRSGSVPLTRKVQHFPMFSNLSAPY